MRAVEVDSQGLPVLAVLKALIPILEQVVCGRLQSSWCPTRRQELPVLTIVLSWVPILAVLSFWCLSWPF
jgi:hypothetical protein